MAEAANFASLGPTLLARKGGAKPAMRPQLGGLTPVVANTVQQGDEHLEDLGWNDMGDEDHRSDHDVVALTPAPANEETAAQARAQDEKAQAELAEAARPAVHKQQEEIARKVAAVTNPAPVAVPVAKVAPVAAPRPAAPARSRRSSLDRGKRAAFTLRLDADRHLKLRLACTIRNRSAQQLVTEALDSLLGDMNELESLAAQVTRN
ncbi:MAG: hypothetical protein H6918_12155 [Sphingomonadaceae bacterium]|nr:hypothetical protein [Sphingomonadaceae bacterium]